MDHPLLPSDISRVLFVRDGVFIWADEDTAPELRITCGERDLSVQRPEDLGRSVPPMPALADPPPVYSTTFPLDPKEVQAVPREAGQRTKVSPSLNALADWTLAGHDTLQLCLAEMNGVTDITLTPEIEIPSSDTTMELTLAIAVHRCSANAVVTVRSDGQVRETMMRLIDAEKFGGKERQGYCNLTFEIPAGEEPRTVQVGAEYHWSHGEQDGPPFIFLTDARVTALPVTANKPVERALRGTMHPNVSCMFAEITMGNVDPADAITLISPKGRADILPAMPNNVQLSKAEPQALTFTAEHAMDFALFLDGQRILPFRMSSDVKQVPLPPSVMTGDVRHLVIKDGWGLRTYLEDAVLLPRVLTTEDHMLRESKAPYPVYLSKQAVQRYDALKRHLASTRDPEMLEQVTWALELLEGGGDNVKLKPLAFPDVAEPVVSVVVPAHNQVGVTYQCLCALLLAHNETPFELIVVDDASSDETAQLEEIVSGITVVRHEESQRFIKACNSGVAVAKGQYVVLLNNDTEPTAGWLDALVDGFERFDNVGLVGSKLLYPDGQLQEAGNIVWNNGEPWNYGKYENPWDPRFCYARQVDYISGAALMTSKAVWDEVGGLSSYLEPMYFEDTDFAFKVRDAGYTTYFIPSSIVYHYEGMTSGTDVSDATSMKSYQEVNRPKFKERWAEAFKELGTFGENPDLEKDRGIVGRVLFIDHETPRSDQDAGSYAAIQEMLIVQSLGFKVTFLPKNMIHMGAYTEELERMGIEVISSPFFRSTDDYLDRHGKDFDAFYITRYIVGQVVLEKIKQVAPEAKVLFNNADLHFLREMRAALAENDREKLKEVRKVRDEELEVMCQADVVLSYNEVEHAVITSHTEGQVKVMKTPWVVELAEHVPPFEGRSGLSFLGNYRHPPNAEGVQWFVQDVMPILDDLLPGATFSIYGSGMPESMKAMASDRVLPKGFVDEISDAYDAHRIFVAPLLSGAGIKGKVIAALAQGTPTVLTPVAAEGIGLRNKHDCLIADTPETYAKAVAELYNNEELWTMLSENARAYVADTFSFEQGRKALRRAFEAVGIHSALE